MNKATYLALIGTSKALWSAGNVCAGEETIDGEYYSLDYVTQQECAKLCDSLRMTLEGDDKKSLCCTHAAKWNYMTDESFGDCTLNRATELEARGDELNFFEETMDSYKAFLYADDADFDNA